MKLKNVLPAVVTAALLASLPANAVISPTTYPFASPGAVLEDMSTGTTQLVAANLDDNASLLTALPFDFWYDGVRFTQFSVNANGLAKLGSPAVTTSFINDSVTTGFATTTNSPKIAPYYDDLFTGTNGQVHFKVIGSAPNRKLVVEWLNMQIPRVAAGNTGAGTFQLWLFETSGVVEFVYGAGIALNSANAGYTVGLQSGAATNFASVTTTGNAVSYAAANSTQTNAITSGTAYTFTPVVPTAPTGLNFTGTTALSTTLNWTDNSSNEVGFAVYRSTDGGATYNFLTQAAANITSFVDSGLTPSTPYFYRVFAVSEGALSSAISNSVTTSAAGSISSVPAGGNWSNTATWVGGVVPTPTDAVTIVAGSTVTIDTAAVAYSVSVAGTGVLQFEALATIRSLTTGGDVTVASGGILQTPAAVPSLVHTMSVGGNLTNNGTLDLFVAGGTGADLTFTGPQNATFGGTGAITDIRQISLNKGSSASSILEVLPTNFTVQGVTTAPAWLVSAFPNGTLKLSGTFTGSSPVFTVAAYTIGATSGFWLNNPNYTVSGQAASAVINGLLRMTLGNFTVGTASGNSISGAAGAAFTIEGGVLNVAGRFNPTTAVAYTQTGGVVNVSTIGNASVVSNKYLVL